MPDLSVADLYNMNLHEQLQAGPHLFVTRVPGGWIYTTHRLDAHAMASVFVPLAADDATLPVPSLP